MKVIIVFLVIGFLIYGNMLGNQFVDDDAQLEINPLFHSISNIPQFFLSGDRGIQNGGYYRPIADTFFTIEYALFGFYPAGYHVVQLLLHIGVSFLGFLVFKKFFSKELSLTLALVFLVHPLNTEAVSYISAFRENLFVLFGLSALLSNKLPLTFICLSASILSKETGIIFLFLTPIYKYLKHREIFKNTCLSVLSVITIYGFFRVISGVNLVKKAIVPIQTLNVWERMIHVPQIVVYYLKNLVYPVNLISNQAWVILKITPDNFYIPLLVIFLVIITMTAGVIYRYKKDGEIKPMIFFGVWLLLALGVHIQIIPLDVTVADRWFYAPMIGVLGFVGSFLGKFKKTFTIPVIFVFIYLSVLTIARNDKWHDNMRLIAHDYAASKNEDYLLEKRYGTELLIAGQLDLATRHLKNANRLFLQNYGAWNNLGTIYTKTGKIDEALAAYKQAIANDNYFGAYQNTAYLLIKYKGIPEAEGFVIKALNLFPDDATLWYYLLIIELKLNNMKEATQAAAMYYRLNPSEQSYTIYSRLQNGEPVIINLN